MKLIAIDNDNCVIVWATDGLIPDALLPNPDYDRTTVLLDTMDEVRSLVGKPETRIERDANGVDFQAMMFSRRT